jgi:hypothetical protein
MVRSISALLFLVICLVTPCSQTPEGKRLIDEINAAKVKARNLGDEAERKRKEARENTESEHDRLIETAAELYGQASNTLKEAVEKSKELAKLQSPPWYAEYFGLQSRLISNLAELAAGANEELLIRKDSAPSEAQVQKWKDNIKRIREENDQFHKQIASIELRQGIVLINE